MFISIYLHAIINTSHFVCSYYKFTQLLLIGFMFGCHTLAYTQFLIYHPGGIPTKHVTLMPHATSASWATASRFPGKPRRKHPVMPKVT